MTNSFRDIDGYSGYKINDYGVVVSYKRYKSGITLNQTMTNKGYMQICLNKNNKSKTLLVHRLVAETFLEKDKIRNNVNHKDGNKTNNHYSNLEWVTHQENIIHSYRVLGNKSAYKGRTGAKHHASIPVCVGYSVFEGMREAARKLNTTLCLIRHRIRTGGTINGMPVYVATKAKEI